MKGKVVKFAIKALISLGFLAWVIFKVDWKEVFNLAMQTDIWQIVFYTVVYMVGISISSYKWQLLAKFKGIQASLFDFFKIYLTGTFINNFMPSFIGGDTFRAYQIGKAEKKFVQGATSVVVDRLTGLLAAMILSLNFSFLNWQEIKKHDALVTLNIIVVLAVVLGIIFLWLTRFGFWQKIRKYMPKKVLDILRDFREYSQISILTKATLMGMLFGLVGLAAVNWILFSAMGVQIGVLNYLSIIFLISVVSSLPISINNVGIKEWAYITFFGFFGVSSAPVIAVAIVSRILQMLISFLALPAYLRSRK